jgi:hypothetical protein
MGWLRVVGAVAGSLVLAGCRPAAQCGPPAFWVPELSACAVACRDDPAWACYDGDGGRTDVRLMPARDAGRDTDVDTTADAAPLDGADATHVDAADAPREDAAPLDATAPLTGQYRGFAVEAPGYVEAEVHLEQNVMLVLGSWAGGMCPADHHHACTPGGQRVVIQARGMPGTYPLAPDVSATMRERVLGQRCDQPEYEFARGTLRVVAADLRLGGRLAVEVDATWSNGDRIAGTYDTSFCYVQ